MSSPLENELQQNSNASINMGDASAIQNYLQLLCERSEGVTTGAVLMLDQKNNSLNKAAQWPLADEPNIAMTNTMNAAIQRSSSIKIVPAISDTGNNQACIISTPLTLNNKTLGAVGLSINTSNNKITTEKLAELEQAASIFSTLLISNNAASRPADANKLLQLQSAFFEHTDLNDAAMAFANNLAKQLKFSRVSIGVLNNQQISLVAISNNAEFHKQQELVVAISSAMEEAADQAESVVYPISTENKPLVHLAHSALFKKTNNAVCCIPLIYNKNIIGVIAFEHDGVSPINREAIIWYEHIANFFAPLLALKLKAETPWLKRTSESITSIWAKFIAQDNYKPKLVIAIASLMFLAFAFFPVSYHVGAKAHLEGATQRIMAAPVEGFIEISHVRPGDIVKKGDVLIELADQDLMLEKEKWESEIIQQENNFSAALARQDRAQYAISQAKASQAQAELALIKQELARSRIVAPMDGLVLEGDLSQSLGAPVNLGDKLMTIAPKDQYRLMIDIDERDINDISVGKRGTLALSAMPLEKMHFIVERITPMATVKEGLNSYEVEAKITDANVFLRPGLQGVAKVEAGKRSILWSLSHRITDWLRLSFWKWGI